MGSALSVTAVVLNWRDVERTLRALHSLVGCERVSSVVVVDNESDGSLARALNARAELSEVRLVELPENRGFAGGFNAALRSSDALDHELVLALNNDAVVTPGAVDALVAAAVTDPDVALFGPRIVGLDGVAEPTSGVARAWRGDTRPPREGEAPDYLTWACVLVRTGALRALGSLDERFFMYWEDVDFGLRVAGAGLRMSTVPEALVVHERSSNKSRHREAIKTYHTWSLVQLARKHRGAWVLGAPAWILGSALKNVLRRDLPLVSATVRGVRLGLQQIGPAYSTLHRMPTAVVP